MTEVESKETKTGSKRNGNNKKEKKKSSAASHFLLPKAESVTKRKVYCVDAIQWLNAQDRLNGSIITSLPDVSEMTPPMQLSEWKTWFRNAAALCMRKIADDSVAIFYQSDIKVDGTWIDKGYLVQRAAEDCGLDLLWHKIVVCNQVDSLTANRASYTHLLCFSKKVRNPVGRDKTPDIVSTRGKMTWTRAMGLNACKIACEVSCVAVSLFCVQSNVYSL